MPRSSRHEHVDSNTPTAPRGPGPRGGAREQDGYEFFAQRQLVTLFSAPNYCGEFDNSGAVMSVDASLMCSFHILKPRSAAPGTPDTVGRGAR